MPKLEEIATIKSGWSYKENLRGTLKLVTPKSINDKGQIEKENAKRVAKKDVSNNHLLLAR